MFYVLAAESINFDFFLLNLKYKMSTLGNKLRIEKFQREMRQTSALTHTRIQSYSHLNLIYTFRTHFKNEKMGKNFVFC